MQLSGNSSHSIFAMSLQALTRMRSDQNMVFSLYLDLRPETRAAAGLPDRFNKLLQQVEQHRQIDQADPGVREQWAGEAGQIRDWLLNQPPAQGQGLALFSSRALNFWQVFALPAPVTDRMVVAAQAYVRPLEILLNEIKCTLVILADADSARLIKVYPGDAQEIAQLKPEVPSQDMVEVDPDQFIRTIIEHAEAAWREHACSRVVIGGGTETLTLLENQLSEPLRQHLSRSVRLSPQAGLDDILAQVREIESEHEHSHEAQLVEELLAGAGREGAAVLGMEQSLLAVRSKKVRLLVVEEGFQKVGGLCPNCGFIGEGVEGICLFCGVALRPEPDIIEAALKRVLEQGGEIEVLRSPGSRRALNEHGHMGALIYHSQTPPTVKNKSNHKIIAKDGKINHDALHDEAIEESFPGSDPPSI